MIAVKEETIEALTAQVKGLENVLHKKDERVLTVSDESLLSFDIIQLFFLQELKFPEEWQIEKRSVQLTKKLDGCSFYEVWKGIWNNTTPVAIKVFSSGVITREEIFHEAYIMTKLQHKNVTQLCALCTKEEPIYIITELMKYNSLLEYLRGDGRVLELPQLIDISTQIEENKIIHRDLAARNIQVRGDLVCKIANFDRAKELMEDVYHTPSNEVFPIKWTAPEAIEHHRYSTKSDIWSFGIVLHEIVTYGGFPYPGMTNKDVIEAVIQGYRMPRANGCPDKLYDTMCNCWKRKPEDRPSFQSLKWLLKWLLED